MMKLLLYRALPLGAAIGIFTGALSPLRPVLNAFSKAADALTGDTSVGGVDAPQLPNLEGEVAKVKGLAQGPQPSKQGQTLLNLATELDGSGTDVNDPYGHQAGARAPKPIQLPGKKAGKKHHPRRRPVPRALDGVGALPRATGVVRQAEAECSASGRGPRTARTSVSRVCWR